MKYILTGLMAMISIMTQAQLKWNYGVKADLSLNNIEGNGMGTGFVAGGELGAFVTADVKKKWGLQAEVLASQNLTKRSGDFLTYYTTGQSGYAFSSENIKLTYLNIPVLFRYRLTDAWSFVAGPQIGFLLNDDENLLKNDQRAFKTNEFSGNVGAEFNISNVALFVRYNKGITNINDVDNRYEWRSQHILMGVAVKFR